MGIKTSAKLFPRRRIFITDGEKSFQICKFWQENDGSIYCCWPIFHETEWLAPLLNKEGDPELKKISSVEEGKLSIHSDGFCAFRAHKDTKNRPLIIKGYRLLDLSKKESSPRHLFTAFFKKPSSLPTSPALSRASDYVINSAKIEPYVMIFIAIPQTAKGLEINFRTGINLDDLENMPPKGGGGIIALRYHDVFWYFYKTKNMDNWPQKNQVIFNDGFVIPFFIGIEPKKIRLELRAPKYSLTGNHLTVEV